MNHYHICWIHWKVSQIDWQPFQTKDEAMAAAERLKRPNENYNIEERDGNCEKCPPQIPNSRA